VDGTKIPVNVAFVPGASAPPARPVADSPFWAQGLDIGLMFRY